MPIVVDGRVDGFQAILLYWTPKLGCHVGDNNEEQSDTGQGHQWGNVMLINTMLHPSKAQRSEKVSEESQSHNCSRYLLSEGEKKKYIIKKMLLSILDVRNQIHIENAWVKVWFS